MHCLNCIRCMQNSTFETGLTYLDQRSLTDACCSIQVNSSVNYLEQKHCKARFPLAIFFARIDIFRRYIFSPVDFFYDRARDVNFKCQQINMAAVNIRHLLNVKINIIRLLLLRRRRKRLEKYKKGFHFDVFMPRENKRANTIFW